MMIIHFLTGLCFGGLGLASYLQYRQAGDFPLRRYLPTLAAFGFAYGLTSWISMFIASGMDGSVLQALSIMRIGGQALTGLLLLKFGWGVFRGMSPLPAWTIFIPGILLVPLAYVITYAATTFVTPSPIEIPIDIWSRYLIYLPGSVLAGIGFLRQWREQQKQGFSSVARLMLAAGIGFLLEAFVVGLIVPAAPYGPASYYNYDRASRNALMGEATTHFYFMGLTTWLDYEQVLAVTGLPIEFWRLTSAATVTFFVVKGLDVFETIRKREEQTLRAEKNAAQQAAVEAAIRARQNAEHWTEALVNINRQIAELSDTDEILLCIVGNTRDLLNSDFIGLALWEQEANCLALKLFSNKHVTQILRISREVKNNLIRQAFTASKPYRSGWNQPIQHEHTHELSTGQPDQALAVVPLKLVDNTPIGVMWMVRRSGPPYLETDLVWLECMADQAVIAIQHGLMVGKLQTLAVVEERARIAREMHDGLAQVLGYFNMQVQALDAFHKQGDNQALQEELGHMQKAVMIAQDDVRENILSLRTTLANEKGVIQSVEEYLAEFSLQTDIKTVFKNEVNDGDLELSSLSEVQMVCILQEALSNVRKHARASQVIVSLRKEQAADNIDTKTVLMEIVDNGVGFQMGGSKRRFGLKTMRERAESIDAVFSITSIPEQGTTILCRIPCVKQESVQARRISIFDMTSQRENDA